MVVLGVLVWLGALALSVFGGQWFTSGLLRRIDRRDREAAGADLAEGVDSAKVRAVLRGGTWIGLLERFAVTGSILVGFPAGIAVVVAIKGLGRFPQLRNNPAASERFVIGTLASVAWAGVAGFLGLWLLELWAPDGWVRWLDR